MENRKIQNADCDQNPAELLTLLGAGIFGGSPSDLWKKLDEPRQLAVLDFAEYFNLDHVLYFYLRDATPQSVRRNCRINFISAAANSAMRRNVLDTLSGLLAAERIEFRELKGNRIADDFYPDPALRISSDIDLLVRKSDAKRAHRLIEANGWTSEHDYIEMPGKHLPELRRPNFPTVEIHTFLFEDSDAEREFLWTADGESRELLALYLMHHAAKHHNFLNGPKTIVDIGCILARGGFDFERYRKLEDRFGGRGLLSAFVRSFPEFFPVETQSAAGDGGQIRPELIAAIRYLSFNDIILDNRENAILQNSGNGFCKKVLYIFDSAGLLSPAAIGRRFHLSKRHLWWSYCPLLLFELPCLAGRYLKSQLKLCRKQTSRYRKSTATVRALLNPQPGKH